MGNTKAVGVSYDDPDFAGPVTVATSLYIAGSAITGSDVGVLAGVTPGTATASKALVLSSGKGIATITSATITTLTSTNVQATNVKALDGTAALAIASSTGVVTAAAALQVGTSTGAVISNTTAGLYILSSAITANSTTTTAPSGSFGITSNATGLGKLFYSDGTKWQFAAIS